jgi:hypothetical protein
MVMSRLLAAPFWTPRDVPEAKAFSFTIIGRAEPLEAALMVGLSKIVDYLIDNICLYILSYYRELKREVKRKAVGLPVWFQFGNVAPTLFAKVLTLHLLRRSLPIVPLPHMQ